MSLKGEQGNTSKLKKRREKLSFQAYRRTRLPGLKSELLFGSCIVEEPSCQD